jgi:hypothetical protein
LYQKKGKGEEGEGGKKGGKEGVGGRESAYKFRGLSAAAAGAGGAAGKGLRKGGKPSHHAFKSKSKHRRR